MAQNCGLTSGMLMGVMFDRAIPGSLRMIEASACMRSVRPTLRSLLKNRGAAFQAARRPAFQAGLSLIPTGWKPVGRTGRDACATFFNRLLGGVVWLIGFSSGIPYASRFPKAKRSF